jgi:hypothetical protein
MPDGEVTGVTSAAVEDGGPLSVTPLTPVFGARVGGALDLSKPLVPELVRAVEAAMDRYAVLVFPGQAMLETRRSSPSAASSARSRRRRRRQFATIGKRYAPTDFCARRRIGWRQRSQRPGRSPG